MSEFGPQPTESEQSNFLEQEENTIAKRASLRKLTAEFKAGLLKLQEPADEKSKVEFDEEKSQVDSELSGMLLERGSAEEKLREEGLNLLKKAEMMSTVAPNLSGFLYAQLAKLELSAGRDYQQSYTKAQEKITQSQNLPKKTLKSMLAEAILIGITKKSLESSAMPSIDQMVQMAESHPEILSSIALVLDEQDRESFMAKLPEDQQGKFSALMDKELSGVLRKDIVSAEEKSQQEAVRSRAETALSEILQPEDQTSKSVIKLLSETLSTLGDEESQLVLKKVGEQSVHSHEYSTKMAASARVIRELANRDLVSGGKLAMEFLGKDQLPEHYFNYFRNFLFSQGFLEKNLDEAGDWNEGRLAELYGFLREKSQEWQDPENVNQPFEEGSKIFGLNKMFTFAGRPDVTRHDALYSFGNIIRLQEQSGLSPDQFYGQILSQVHMDSSSYESGLSYHELNSIAQSLDFSEQNLSRMQEKVNRYPNIDKLKDLGNYFNDPKTIFGSWNNLRKFSELLELLGKAEILDELEELKEESLSDPKKAKLYKFIETLAFHPDSKVNMSYVLKFWRDPESFLELMDEHTNERIQNSKKPSNYTEIPHLDLTAEELRDALVSGELDRIQAFPAMEIIYSISGEGLKTEIGFHEEVRREVGSRKDSSANTVLFNEVNKILKAQGIDTISYLRGDDSLLDNLPAAEFREIERQIREAIAEYPNPKLEQTKTPLAKRYRAKVNLKSDPQAVLAGNDTACCMWFGSGKNNIYMFNPNCALFTLEEEKGAGSWRTIAQSVLTLDQNIGQSVPQVVSALSNESGNVSEGLSDAVLDQKERFLACDNIEIAGNAKDKLAVVEAAYRDFFEKYVAYYNEKTAEGNLNQDKIIIGQGYSDIRMGSQEPNTYAPAAPVGYSDKLGPNVDVIIFRDGHKSEVVVTTESENREATQETEHQRTGVLPLTFKDSLAVGFLEGKAYAENESLMTHLHNMENGLIAKDINNIDKNRSDLSLKYVDDDGRMRGYMLAYECKDHGQSMVYIGDLATDRESRLAGGRLMSSFVDVYKANYIDKNNFVPIYLEARESTSYPIIKNGLASIENKLGVRLRIDEEGTYREGGDIMHPLWLRPVR